MSRSFPSLPSVSSRSGRIGSSLRAVAAHPALLWCLVAGLLAGVPARAAEIEPRAYANAPVGVNFLIAGYAYTF